MFLMQWQWTIIKYLYTSGDAHVHFYIEHNVTIKVIIVNEIVKFKGKVSCTNNNYNITWKRNATYHNSTIYHFILIFQLYLSYLSSALNKSLFVSATATL